MRNLRQRYIPQGHADETDTSPMETSGDEGENEMPSMQEATTTPSSAESVSGMVNFLKAEHLGCLERSEFWDANAIQGVIFSIFGRDQRIVWIEHFGAMPRYDFSTVWRFERPCH